MTRLNLLDLVCVVAAGGIGAPGVSGQHPARALWLWERDTFEIWTARSFATPPWTSSSGTTFRP